jgi:thymidylate synthase (FAD)
MKLSVTPIAMTQPLVSFIPDGEGLMAYCARVSNPSNQNNFATADGLLKYCAKHGHWSVFEMVNVVLEIKAARDISRQILRHKSAAFQEFSQRYADVTDDMFTNRELRMQDDKNRQNSNALPDDHPWHDEFKADQDMLIQLEKEIVAKWRERGVAKECTRVFWSEGLTMSSMYVNMNVRTLAHWLKVRTGNGTQKEHILVAQAALKACEPLFPQSWSALVGEQQCQQ